MEKFLYVVDYLMAFTILLGVIQHVRWVTPDDGEDRIRRHEYVVRFMDAHRHWYAPVVLGLIGIVASVMLYFNLLFAGLAELVCGIVLLMLHYRLWRRYHLQRFIRLQ